MIEIRPLAQDELEQATAALPLHRLVDHEVTAYLVAWDDGQPVGHVYVAWSGTQLGVPELQDMWVLPDRRGSGIGTVLVRAAERGHRRCSLSVSAANDRARRLYERLGYRRADVPPARVRGVIEVRGGTIEVDDTLLFYVRAVDFPAARTS